MKRIAWFILGFLAFAIILVVWLQSAGLLQLGLVPAQSPQPTDTRPGASPIATDVPPYALIWERDNPLADQCDVLRVDRQGRALYGQCRQILLAGQLLPQEQTTLQSLLARFAPVDETYQTSPGALDNEQVRLRLAGSGSESIGPGDRLIIATFAQQVYDRLRLEDVQTNLVALARGHLAGRLNVPPEQIRIVSIDAVNWVDRCLGVPIPGQSCAPITTPGLRIMLAVGDRTYEYRTDLLGRVLPFDIDALPGLTPTWVFASPGAPTATPTWTPTAPSVPPSPTALPTATATPVVFEGWQGAYYDNRDLIEPPVLRRDDPELSFNWGDLSPAPGIPDDRFSVRWTRRVTFRQGYYRFDVQADDGARLWVAGNLVLDHWRDGYTEHSVEVFMNGGQDTVVLEYYENEGLAEVGLSWRLMAPGPRRTATPTPEPVFEDWRGAYFNNTLFVGDPVVVRNDEAIDFDWDDDEPAAGLPEDRFAVRWTRSLWFPEGAYRFFASVDDGMRLWVDDSLAIDDWRAGSLRDIIGYRWLSEGVHDLRVEYFEDVGVAEAHLGWDRIQEFVDWRGAYYDNRFLDGDPVVVRNDAAINFDWGTGAPAIGIPGDNFSVRWTRSIYIGPGRYRFHARVDDGVRVYLDDALLIDQWHDASETTYQRTIDLIGGVYNVRVEYYERTDEAICAVGWTQE